MTEQVVPREDTASYTQMTADVYDAIYSWKNYEAETARLEQLVKKYKKTDGNDLLEVACGTGLYLQFLKDKFSVVGVDLSEQQLVGARKRLPGVSFVQGDMRDFDLHRQFDVVTCLFSSIGYVHPFPEMEKAIQNMSRHLKQGGILVVEPWLQPDVFDPNRPPHTETGELPEKHIKVTRTGYNSIEGNISILTLNNVVETPEGIREFTEKHSLALYTLDEYRQAFETASLVFNQEEPGLTDRDLYVGIKP